MLGVLPAAAAGLAFALYDAWAPRAAPRALGAALIGAVFAHGLYLLLLSAGVAVGAWIEGESSAPAKSSPNGRRASSTPRCITR